MDYKKEVNIHYEPFAMCGSVTYGNLRFECPECHNGFQVKYSKSGDKESPLPKLCPFCGNELTEGE